MISRSPFYYEAIETCCVQRIPDVINSHLLKELVESFVPSERVGDNERPSQPHGHPHTDIAVSQIRPCRRVESLPPPGIWVRLFNPDSVRQDPLGISLTRLMDRCALHDGISQPGSNLAPADDVRGARAVFTGHRPQRRGQRTGRRSGRTRPSRFSGAEAKVP